MGGCNCEYHLITTFHNIVMQAMAADKEAVGLLRVHIVTNLILPLPAR